MKRIILFAALALGLVSCSKENPESVTDIKNSLIFTADIVNEGEKTQIDIVEETGKKVGKVSWVFDAETGESDVITIKDAGETSAQYHIIAIGEDGRATFAPLDDQQPVLGDGPYTATYGDIDNQVYDPKHLGSNCPMVGVSADSEDGFPHLNFHNTAAVISVKVHSDGAILKYVSAAGKELKLSPNVNITKETTFDIAIPAGNYEEGVEMKFRCINGIIQKKKTKALSLEANQLHPVKITKGLDFDMDPLDGRFSVSEAEVVRFAPGNVVMNTDGYDCSFEAEQFYFHTAGKLKNQDDYICDSLGIRKNPDNLKGLFRWPENSEQREEVERTFPGWDLLINGKDNDPADKAEWKYLTMLRTTVCTNNEALNNARYTFIVIKDSFVFKGEKEKEMELAGMILFPDSFAWPEDVEAPNPKYINFNGSSGNWGVRSHYTIEQFKKMENAGIVYLPAGARLNESNGPKTQNTNFMFSSNVLVLNTNYAMGSYMTNLYESDTYFKFTHATPKFTEDGGNYGRSIRFVVREEKETE